MLKRWYLLGAIVLVDALMLGQTSKPSRAVQSVLGTRTVQLLSVDGLRFKDLDHNGLLDPYEDWRLSPEIRTKDLLRRLSVDDLAGLMVHASLNGIALTSPAIGYTYDFNKSRTWIVERHINSFVTRLNGSAVAMAIANNKIQEIAESSDFGIPVTISADPKRHHIHQMLDASAQDCAFSLWPDPLGFAAIGDPNVTQQFGDIVRREYMAVGIRESLAPQADLATEPRWSRTNGTFGEDATIASRMVEAYVTGVQAGAEGLGTGSVIAVVKHWVGYGAAKDGWDSHNYYGRLAIFESDKFYYHVEPFNGAFKAHVGGVMPSYSVLQGVALKGRAVEPVAAGYSRQLLEELLRGEHHFNGVVLSDWLITHDCLEGCRQGAVAGGKPNLKESGMPWGVEELSEKERFAKAINAGVDQIGGTEASNLIVDDFRNGLITESRMREAAARILLQKFQLGLFEQPYVDERQVTDIAGSADFAREGQEAQAKAVVLLENKPSNTYHKPLLPITIASQKVYLYGVARAAAEAVGLVVVDDPTKADFAIVRAPAPYESEHQNFYFGSRQHEGRLNFTSADAAYVELLRVSRTTPTIFVTTLERPLILTNVKPHVSALLGDFGLADAPLFALITGRATPEGHLPFELPSSVEAVRNQASDLPHDSLAPLYPFGYGLHY
jgi:beta-glucosidase